MVLFSAGNEIHGKPKILLVEDDEAVRTSLSQALEHKGFEVLTAVNVNGAHDLIGTQAFDVLVSDLHMPGPGDGLSVISAMRHANPHAVTLILSDHPEMKEATAAILLQADQIMVKPIGADALAETIKKRLGGVKAPLRLTKSVGTILQDDAEATIADWLQRVESEPEIISVRLEAKERTAHLPALFEELVGRLRCPLPLGTRGLVSPAAVSHGTTRRQQGYSAAMMVEESRMLQVSIFQTLQRNLSWVNFSVLLLEVMAIADEVDSQLAQQMTSYISESNVDAMPVTA